MLNYQLLGNNVLEINTYSFLRLIYYHKIFDNYIAPTNCFDNSQFKNTLILLSLFDLNHRDAYGMTALDWAISTKNLGKY